MTKTKIGYGDIMYEVQMKYINVEESDNPFAFKCESFSVGNNGYRFENILMDNFIIGDLEVNNDDIALIKIR